MWVVALSVDVIIDTDDAAVTAPALNGPGLMCVIGNRLLSVNHYFWGLLSLGFACHIKHHGHYILWKTLKSNPRKVNAGAVTACSYRYIAGLKVNL